MKQLRALLLLLASFMFLQQCHSQILDPVKVKSSVRDLGNGEYELVFGTEIDKGWHIFSQFIDSGPIKSSINLDSIKGYELVGKPTETGKRFEANEPLFDDAHLIWYEEKATFRQKIKVTAAQATVKGYFEYQTCNDRSCLPPTDVDFSFNLKGGTSVSPQKDSTSKSLATPIDTSAKEGAVASSSSNAVDTSQNKTRVAKTFSAKADEISQKSWWKILLGGFGGGLLALLTPCVFPMIPLTVSYFTKRSGSRKKGITNAFTYGISIIVIYVALGFIITKLLGSDALNDLASNAVFNIAFFVIFIIFAISFFGAFEITLPSSWLNRSESMADRGGLIGIFFMAFTLALVSFSCTGPIIGTLLVEAAVDGNNVGPLLGMSGFAIALALPFGLFAMFPDWLKSMPKSGGWLNTVKVTLGFLELALALKFLSNVDLAYHWGILDREVFLVLWITIFSLLGFYLLGYIRFAHDSEVNHVTIPRLFLAILSLAFAVYMIPGLWGHPLKAISAFSPPQSTMDFDLSELLINQKIQQEPPRENIPEDQKKYAGVFHCPHDIDCYFDYQQGLQVARELNKPVMLDFTGWSCVNCRKMEVSVWSDPEVLKKLTNDYVLISMYVDDKTRLPDSNQYVSSFNKKRIKTLGNWYSDIQATQYGTNSQPYYILIDPKRAENDPSRLLSKPRAFNLNIDEYISFLNNGLEEYQRRYGQTSQLQVSDSTIKAF